MAHIYKTLNISLHEFLMRFLGSHTVPETSKGELKKIQQVLNLLQCQERYTYVVTRENDKRAEEKHPEADEGEELPNFCMSNLP